MIECAFQNESSTATELKSILMTLNFPKPPENIPPKALFSKVEEKVYYYILTNNEYFLKH